MKIPVIDYILYGGLAAIAFAAATVVTLLVPLEVGALVTVWATSTGFLLVALIVILSKVFGEPDWISAQGIQIWFGGISWFDRTGKQGFNHAIEIFIREVCAVKGFQRNTLVGYLSGVTLKWTDSNISLVGIGWDVKDKAGLQHGPNIMVKWNSGIVRSALIHELIHYVRQRSTGLEPDYKHEDLSWWNLSATVNSKIARELPYVG